MKKYCAHIYIVVTAATIVSCSGLSSGGSASDVQESYAFLDKLCTEWGSSATEVAGKMGSQKPVSTEGETLMYYDDLSGCFISYAFTADKLTTSNIIVPSGKAEKQIISITSGYNELGLLEGVSFYSNESNTLLFSYETDFDGDSYQILGFTPIDSEGFPYIPPVMLSLDDKVSVGLTDAVVKGVVSNTDTPISCTLYYGTMAAITSSNATGHTTVSSDGDLLFELTGLSHSTTYYCFAATEVDGFTVQSPIVSFTTQAPPSYAIGDYWPDSINPEGVVFYLSDSNGYHGKIVSLTTGHQIQWDKDGIFCTDYNYNSSDGSLNRGPIYGYMTTAYSWCKEYGDGTWYLPATSELKTLSRNWWDNIRIKVGHTYMDTAGNYFWSSTQYNSNMAYIVSLIDGNTTYNSKDQKRHVIAVKKF